MSASEKNTSKFKTCIKDLLPSYVTVLAFSFMLFFYEPLMMYATNQMDFWFDLPQMMLPVSTGFAIFLFGGLLVFTAVYFINKRFAKNNLVVYEMLGIALFFAFLVTYIQGSVLVKGLPALDGAVIDWSGFGSNDLITLAIWIIIGVALIYIMVKLGTSKTLRYTLYASAALFIILLITLLFELINWNAFARKDSTIATNVNFSKISSDKNFVIFLTDAVGSSEFKSVIDENPEYKETFEDFTFFHDTLGGYPCTRDTIPLVLGGQFNKNEMKFEDFATKAFNESPLFAELTERNYEINLYEPELIWYGKKSSHISNTADYNNFKLKFSQFFPQEIKYIGYKYLPYFFKKYSGIESMDFNGLVDKFIWDNRTIYGMINSDPTLQKQSARYFSFIHSEGAHIPFKYDKDLNIIESGSYEQKIESAITMVNAYIERLKANGVYDNTVIIIMADHGNTNLNSADDMLVRANPMFMVKGIGEHHEFAESEKPLSYADLMGIFAKLLDDKSAAEATADIPDKRERTFMWYRNYRLEHHIEEYVVTDKAWEWQKFKKTGNEYDL